MRDLVEGLPFASKMALAGDGVHVGLSKGYPQLVLKRGGKCVRARLVHRVVMACFLGRQLLPDEHVHHIDGCRWNNELGNLVVMSRWDHWWWHQLLRGGVDRRRVWPLLRRCEGASGFEARMLRTLHPRDMAALGVLEFELPCPSHLLDLTGQAQRAYRLACVASVAFERWRVGSSLNSPPPLSHPGGAGGILRLSDWPYWPVEVYARARIERRA